MTQKTAFHFIALACLTLLLAACTTPTTQTTDTTPADGRVVMTVTDAAADMGAVTKIMMTVDSVALHTDAGGWETVATPHRTYDLLALKASGTNALLADLALAPARYDQIRLEVSSVTITDASGTHEAKLPSHTLRLNGEIVVLANKTATVSFDFIADQSLHMTGSPNNKYVFAPVIQLESRTDANADVTATQNVRLSGGTQQTSSRVGMDVDGNLVVGGHLPPFLVIENDGTITGTEAKLKTNITAPTPPINSEDENSRISDGPINPNDLNSRIE
jgi:hypothetical protein